MSFISGVSKLVDDVEQVLGLTKAQTPGASSAGGLIPEPVPGRTQTIDPTRWNELFQYEFRLFRSDPKTGRIDITKPIGTVPTGIIESYMKLNLPPVALNAQTSFAMVAAPTNDGILEESNGVQFRNITIQGTTGLYPMRQNLVGGKTSGALGIATALFPEATSEALGLVAAAKKTIQSIDPSFGKKGKNTMTDAELQNTGYFQFWRLHNFFVAYAEAKKKKEYNDLRIAFISHKDNIGYVFTPVSFDLRRDAQSPLQYRYSITMKVWEVFTPNSKEYGDFFDGPDIREEGLIKSMLETVRRARNTLQKAEGVIRGFQSDIASVVTLCNQVYLAGADAVGIAGTMKDFTSFFNSNSGLIYQYNKNVMDEKLATFNTTAQPGEDFPVLNQTAAQTAQDLSSAEKIQISARGGKGEFQPSPIIEALLSSDAAAESVTLDEVSLPPGLAQQLAEQRESAITGTSSGQVRDLSDHMQEVVDNYAANVSVMDAEYASTYGLPAPVDSGKVATEDDLILMADLQASKEALLGLVASGEVFVDKEPNPFNDANAVLDQTDQLTSPISGTPIFVPRGSTLDDIAYQYFGDVTKSRDIAILNNLRAPYIDEEGFVLPIFSATGRTFVIQDGSNIVLNQAVVLSAPTVAATRRRIVKIEDIGGDQRKITVDGNPDLDKYTPISMPILRARLPGTVGSGDVILLPSLQAPDDSFVDRQTPLLAKLSHAERVFKIDLAWDFRAGDLAFESSGDFQRSFGYANAVQALSNVVQTEEGELNLHPQYGLPAAIGQPNTTLSAEQLVDAIKKRVTADPRFADADVQVVVKGSAIIVRVDAEGSAGTGRIPVEFQINT